MNDKENARTAAAGNASPAGKKGYRIALAGNPNCGKTTLFNAYTGSRQHVGNYPGVTVDRKEGTISVDNTPVTLVDLPGTYSPDSLLPGRTCGPRRAQPRQGGRCHRLR